MKKILRFIIVAAVTTMLMATIASAAYKDVPAESPLAGEVHKATEYGLMNGYNETTFGYQDSMTRAQFVTVLDRMMGWSDKMGNTRVSMWRIPETMQVPMNLSETYLGAIEQAQMRDVVNTAIAFRPSDPITRGEMAEMLVRALGLKGAAESLNSSQMPFSDAYSI